MTANTNRTGPGNAPAALRRVAGAALLTVALTLLPAATLAFAATATRAGSATHKPGKCKKHKQCKKHKAKNKPAGKVAFFNREAYYYASSLSLADEARRYSILVLQQPDGKLIPALHAANPHLLVLMYESIAFARTNDPPGLIVCSTLQQAFDDNWILRGDSGQPVTPLNDPSVYAVDVGLPSYQQACARHAIAMAKSHGFDGIFFDGTGANPDFQLGGHVDIPKYPTQAAWMTSMTSFIKATTAVIHANGLRVMANIGGTIGPQAWDSWSPMFEGSMEESWTDGGLGPAQQLPWWREKLQNLAWSEAHHKYVLLHSYNNSESENVFGLGSMLLVANGYASYSTANSSYVDGSEHWFPEYTTAENLGSPTGNYRILPNGVYERGFANGIVLVNPSQSSVGPIKLPRTYSGSGYTHADSVSLGPTSALILTNR